MTGAGFGGCVVAIIKKDLEQEIIHNVTKIYSEAIGYSPTFYSVVTENGTHKI
jgi:galactokinase